MGDILMRTISNIVSDEIRRKAKQKKKSADRGPDTDVDFVSLLALSRPHFDWYMDSLKRSFQNDDGEKADNEGEGDIEVSKSEELEKRKLRFTKTYFP